MNDLSSIQARVFGYQPRQDLLSEQVILITGANRGIGRALAIATASVGARTVLMARDVRQIDALADYIVERGGQEPGVIPIDLEGASVDDYTTVANVIAERYSKVDGVVLNAGILGEMAPLASYDPISWARVFQVNVHSQFLLLQAVLPLMGNETLGSIVFTSSGVGRNARAYWGAYAASKFATEGMMQTLSDELATQGRIRANAINPGRVRTQMRAAAYPAEDPLQLREPDEITDGYLFLLGPDSHDVNGMSLDAQAPR
ncbi:MAG: NAD(P)-dependent dehydrogenase (short-subunit alcohol dehydrogenase family) [Gammaproteobacteria bacterium]|jgi:NAD(P)-dependent dehydrogenase (short-subunit alcohol dehydrogenase family)